MSIAPLQLGEKVSTIHLAAAADSFGASEALFFRSLKRTTD
jgi:hypothetical protein